jgi:hypothetical protein
VSRRAAAVALALAAALVAVIIAWAGAPATPDRAAVAAGPARHRGPQGRVGQFVATCEYSHSATDDPIVHFGHPGRSHRHDFYGAVATDAASTAADLARQETTCDKRADTAAYWHPTLYDGDAVVEPRSLVAYYRAAPGVAPTDVEVFPEGLAMIAGDATATAPPVGEAAGWVCGASTRLSSAPPDCPARAPLHMLLTFPDCWDGRRLDSDDHRSHVGYSNDGDCPATHPVHIPQLTMSVGFPISGSDHALSLASGSVYSAHGDFLNAWNGEGLAREVEACIHRDVVCDLASNRGEEAPFFSG